MATKQQATDSARRAWSRNCFTGAAFIYRVGSQWMFTTVDKQKTQKLYKREIKEWQRIEK